MTPSLRCLKEIQRIHGLLTHSNGGMSMFQISCFHSPADLTLHRQVPGLQPKKSQQKKRGVSNLENRTCPDLVECILAQRARRAEINANNQERLFPPNPVQQSPAAQQMSNTEAGGS